MSEERVAAPLWIIAGELLILTVIIVYTGLAAQQAAASVQSEAAQPGGLLKLLGL
jgi:hypothetical protein